MSKSARSCARQRHTLWRVIAAGLVAMLLTLAGVAEAPSAAPPKSAQVASATKAFAGMHGTYPGVSLAVISPRVRWTGSA